MVSELAGVGEWGFAALVEVDGEPLLFDTGWRPETVLQNSRELDLDLSGVESVVLSHNHFDHSGGLVSLRESHMQEAPVALGEVHVGKGIFLPREADLEALAKISGAPMEYLVNIHDVRTGYEAAGGRFVIHDEPHEFRPGVWITGPIPRRHPEKNWTPISKIRNGDILEEDNIPEDQALVIDTAKGLIVVAGCAPAGIVNTLEYAREITGGKSVHAVIGGFHLLNLDDGKLAWTGDKMEEFGVEWVIGAHCTGLNAVRGLQDAADLDRETAVVGVVGSTFTLADGIRPGFLNR
jgi:7,8-dihydropterin-6-yl-methyl-4-(beta-D-ribofuranosyl)aminobenzene 5'-phosphate synthase